MKKLLFLLMIPVVGLGQKAEVLEVAKTKTQLYSSSLEWIAKKWRSANDVIQSKDFDGGIIIVKGGLDATPYTLGIPASGMTETTLTIRVKDNKAKIEFEDTNFKWKSGGTWFAAETPKSGKKQWAKWKNDVIKEITEMISDYKKELAK